MNRPPIKTMLLGHPLIGLPIYGVGAFVLYQCWHDPSLWLFGVGALAAMSTAAKASDQADAYRNWKRAWDAMGDDVPRRQNTALRQMMGILLVIMLGGYLAANRDQPGYAAALVWMVVVGVAGGLFVVIRSLMRRRRRKPAKQVILPVSIAVRRPLIASGDLMSAYRALPEHCQRLLRNA